MKIYTCFTDSHSGLLNEYFIKSLPRNDNIEVILDKYPQECPTANYLESGWELTARRKINLILQAIEDNMGSIFIWADADIQFFKPFVDDCIEQLGNFDLVSQNNFIGSNLCPGFFICRGNENTKAFFEAVLNTMDTSVDMQLAMSRNASSFITYKILDAKYLSLRHFGITTWQAFDDIPEIDQDTILFHANWTVGVENKVTLLDEVRNRVLDSKISPLNSEYWDAENTNHTYNILKNIRYVDI